MTRRIAAALASSAVGAIVLTGLVSTSVSAVEEQTFIPTGDGSKYVAVSPDGTTAYVTNMGGDSVSVIDVATATEITDIPVGDEPHGVDVSPDGSLVYVTNMASQSVTVINAATNTVSTTIQLNRDWSYNVDFTPDGTKAYVANYNDNSAPSGAGSVTVIDVATSSVITTLDTPGYPEGIEVTPDGSKVYAALTADGLAIIDVATDTVDEIIATPGIDFATSVVFSPDGSTAYFAANGGNKVVFFDVATQTVTESVAVTASPNYIDVTPDGSTLYVSVSGFLPNGVQSIDVATATAGPLIPAGDFPTGVSVTPDGNSVYVASATGVSVLGVDVTRVSGADRYDVAVQISQLAYPGTAPVVYVATGANYPDALSAGPAAAVDGGPLLLTPGDALSPVVRSEIQRLDPAKIYVVGGVNSVSPAVYNQLSALAPDIERLAGADRFEASRNIVAHAFGASGAPIVYIATGRNFPDALSAGAVGAAAGIPVILVDGTATALDAGTLALLDQLNPTTIKIAGGPVSVVPELEAQLATIATTTRLWGATRYEASLAINQDAYDSATEVFLATGLKFPDALAGSSLAGVRQAPLFVVSDTCIPAGTRSELYALGVNDVTLLGGPASLTQSVFDLVPCP